MQAIYNESFGDVLIVQNWENTENSDIILTNKEVTIFSNKNNEVSLNIHDWSKYSIENDRLDLIEEKVNEILIRYSHSRIELVSRTNLIIGEIIKSEKSEKSDKLNICQVDLGHKTEQIVCGGTNVKSGIKVVVATIGTIMPDGLVIRPGKLMGFESNGMICSAGELGIDNADKPGEILIVENAVIGSKFKIKE
jgi:tRNA-binding protein